MGPSVFLTLNAPSVSKEAPRYPKQQTKAILRSILHGLCFLHANGVVHGDLHSGNVLFAIQHLNPTAVEQLRQDASNSQVESLERIDGKMDKWAPKYLAAAMPLKDYVLSGPLQQVKISDLGSGT